VKAHSVPIGQGTCNGLAFRLKNVAGFRHVPDPLPMRNKMNAVVCYLFFASQKPVAKKLITEKERTTCIAVIVKGLPRTRPQ
jgi:hypothetical protein